MKSTPAGVMKSKSLLLSVGPGLPDGLFSNQTYQFGSILKGIAMKDVGLFYGHLVYIFYGHLVYRIAIWYSLWCNLVHFSRFGILHQEKSGNPALDPQDSQTTNKRLTDRLRLTAKL
jgi:hypothetical protein